MSLSQVLITLVLLVRFSCTPICVFFVNIKLQCKVFKGDSESSFHDLVWTSLMMIQLEFGQVLTNSPCSIMWLTLRSGQVARMRDTRFSMGLASWSVLASSSHSASVSYAVSEAVRRSGRKDSLQRIDGSAQALKSEPLLLINLFVEALLVPCSTCSQTLSLPDYTLLAGAKTRT